MRSVVWLLLLVAGAALTANAAWLAATANLTLGTAMVGGRPLATPGRTP